MSNGPLHEMILADSTHANPAPAFVREILDRYDGTGVIRFHTNSYISRDVITSGQLVGDSLFDEHEHRIKGLAEDLIKGLNAIPSVDEVVLGSPTAFSFHVGKVKGYSWDEVTKDVLTVLCLLLDDWMDHNILFINSICEPFGASVEECEFDEQELDPYTMIFGVVS